MNVKKVIILLISFFFILLTVFFLYFFQFKEIERTQNEIADEVILKLLIEVKQGEIKNSTLSNLPDKLFYAVWIKKGNESWKPIVYDITALSRRLLTTPLSIPNRISFSTRSFTKKINDYQFVVWINKYNTEYIFKYIILTFLFIVLIYLFIILIIEMLFRDKPIDEYDELIYEEDKRENSDENEDENQNFKNENDKINYYKELWIKNFNISDDFKDNFPFKDIYNLISISTKTTEYIKKSIGYASNYFNWENPKLFINQGNYFVDVLTKDNIKPNNLNIPDNGKQKGEVLIPLFPYNSSHIYGYFYFKWNNENDFFISDLLYFLKFLFSEKAEFIFKNYENIEAVHNKLDNVIKDNKKNILFGILEIDAKDRIKKELNKNETENIITQIIKYFEKQIKELNILRVSPFTFALIGSSIDEKNVIIKEIEKWIKETNNQYFQVSKEDGDIALTYSCGLSFKDNREIHSKTLIIEAEKNLLEALEKGGNTLISN